MKALKISDVRNMQSVEEIRNALADRRQELMNLRFQVITGQQTDTSSLKARRRDIARLETILRERELAAKEGAK